MTYYIRPEHALEARRRFMRHFLGENEGQIRTFSFPVKLSSNKDEYVITALLPGLGAEAVNIEFTNGTLSISGEYLETVDEGYDVHFSDLAVGRFHREFEITEPILVEKIEASMKDGVLKVRVPKAEESKPKTIKVKVN
jgi:HSP20 family protein